MKTVLVLCLFASHAFAAPADDVTREAKRLRVLSVQARERGEFDKALEYAKEAMQYSSSPNLHYNAGLVLKDLHRYPEAIAEFKKFLEAPAGDPAARPDAIQEIESLNLKLHEPAPVLVAPPPVPIELPAPPVKHPPRLRVPVIVGAGALVLTAVGAGLLGSAEADYHTLQTSCKSRLCSSGDWSSSQRNERAGTALLAIGGVAVAVDVVLWVVMHKRQKHYAVNEGWRF